MTMVTMMTVMVVMTASLDERFVILMLLAREPRAQRKDWPESVGENHVRYLFVCISRLGDAVDGNAEYNVYIVFTTTCVIDRSLDLDSSDAKSTR